MQFYTILTLALSTFGVAAIPTPQDDTPANFKVATMTYEGPLRVNGPSVKLSGTVESIYSQILKLNPNFDSEKFPAIPGPTDTTLGDDDEIGGNNKTLDAARDKPFGLNCKCDGNRAPSGAKVYDGINYLLRLPGKCGIFSGPSVCTRVSCSHHNAIYACNDVTKKHMVPCKHIGQYAAMIMARCPKYYYWDPRQFSIKGQWVTLDGWNTLINMGDC